jgi:hypothetical protein
LRFLSRALLSFALITVIFACPLLQAEASPFRAGISKLPQPLISNISPRLEWRGGLSLSSWTSGFGGISGLLTDETGQEFTALTDKASIVTGNLTYDANGHLESVTNTDITDLDVESSIVFYKRNDSESLARMADGSIMISFERAHRFRRYQDLAGPGQTLNNPVAIQSTRLNNGVEAITELSGNRLFAVAEKLRRQGGYRAWIYDGNKWDILVYPRDQRWQPTGATTSPDGSKVWLTERRFHGFSKGFEARLVELDVSTIQPGARLAPKVLAHFPPGTTLGRNFEAIAAATRPSGETWLYLMTDNNFNPLQPTLLIAFSISD